MSLLRSLQASVLSSVAMASSIRRLSLHMASSWGWVGTWAAPTGFDVAIVNNDVGCQLLGNGRWEGASSVCEAICEVVVVPAGVEAIESRGPI